MSLKITVLYIFTLKLLTIPCEATTIMNNMTSTYQHKILPLTVSHFYLSSRNKSNFIHFLYFMQILIKIQDEIIRHCFNESKQDVIFVNSDSVNGPFVIKSLYSSSVATYLFEAAENSMFKMHKRYQSYVLHDMHLIRKDDPARGVIISASSNTNLTFVLEGMRDSIWWNHEALFLIETENFDNGCRMA